MSTKSDPVDRLEGLDPVAFPPLVLELWRRAGWSIEEQGDWDDTFLVVDEDRGNRNVLRTLTHTDGRVSVPAIRNAKEAKERHGTDGVTVVSPVGFTKAALSAADSYSVDAVGPDTIGRLIGALDATDLLAEPT